MLGRIRIRAWLSHAVDDATHEGFSRCYLEATC